MSKGSGIFNGVQVDYPALRIGKLLIQAKEAFGRIISKDQHYHKQRQEHPRACQGDRADNREKARHTDEGRDEVADIWDQPLQGAVQSLVNAGIQFHNLPAFGALIGDGLHFIHQPLAEREVRGHPYFLI